LSHPEFISEILQLMAMKPPKKYQTEKRSLIIK